MRDAIIGEAAEIDDNVIIGYRTGRAIEYVQTVIGAHARIRSGTVIYQNVRIGAHLETGHNVAIREEVEIGDHLSIWNNSIIDYGVKIGNNVRIHVNCYVSQISVIEDDVFMAPGVVILNDPHPLCTLCLEGATIKCGARIGGNVTILPWVTIGEHALVGGGAVVTRDVPPRAVVVGNPAKIIGDVDSLRCAPGLVQHPYLDGIDVLTRKRRGEKDL